MEMDNQRLLDKVSAKVKDWEHNARQLKTQKIAKAKPFHILFILSRWAEKNLQNIDAADFEAAFYDIIRDDIKRLDNDRQIKGFANALIDFASIFVHRRTSLSQVTFLRLADKYNQNAEDKIDIFENYKDSQPDSKNWGILRYYVSVYANLYDRHQKLKEVILTFNKVDLAEAIVEEFGERFERRRKETINFIINDDSIFSASRLLYTVSRYDTLFNNEEKIALVRKLIEKGNGHHAYASLLVCRDPVLDFETFEDRWELVEAFLKISPKNYVFQFHMLRWLERNVGNKAKRV